MTIDGRGPGQPRPATETVAQPRPASPTVVQQAFQIFTAVVDAQSAEAAEIGKKTQEEFRQNLLTEKALQERKATVAPDSPLAQMTDAAAQAVADRDAQARQRYNDLLAGLTKPGDSAQEQRNTRYLQRVERELAAADSPGKRLAVAQGLMEKADPAQLGLLAEDLPSRFAGSDTSWIEAKLAQVNPQIGSAAKDVKLSARCHEMSLYAAKAIRDGFASGSPPRKLDMLASAIERLDPDRQ